MDAVDRELQRRSRYKSHIEAAELHDRAAMLLDEAAATLDGRPGADRRAAQRRDLARGERERADVERRRAAAGSDDS